MYEEKRRWQRHNADAPLKILVEGTPEESSVEGRCIKISDGGMCFFAVGNFVPGERIRFRFLDPDSGESGHGRGTIRSRTVYLYGVEYDRNSIPENKPY
jgi:hypothetical protein